MPATPNLFRRRMVLGLLIVLSLFLVPAGLISYWYVLASREMGIAITEADRLDPGWRREQLEAKREKIADADNNAFVVIKAADLIPANWPTWSGVRFPDEKEHKGPLPCDAPQKFGAAFDNLPPHVLYNDQQVEALRGELRLMAAALSIAQQVLHKSRGRLPSNSADSKSFSETHKARRVCQLLLMNAYLSAHDQDQARAAELCRAMFHAINVIGDKPDMSAQTTRFAGQHLVCDALQRVLAQGEMPVKELPIFQGYLKKELDAPVLLTALRASRVEMDEILIAAAEGKVPLDNMWGEPDRWQALRRRIPGNWQQSRAAVLKMSNAAVEMAKRPPHLQDWKAITSHDPTAQQFSFASKLGLK